MIYEIVHAVAGKGIIKGQTGFCPVAITAGTPKNVIKPLMDLAIGQVQHASRDQLDPEKRINHSQSDHDFYSHFPVKISGQRYNLLTRGSAGNAGYIVHQLLVSDENLWTCGPAAVLAANDHWFTQWSAAPQMLKPRTIEMQPLSPRICHQWKEATKDEGWAGVPVEAFEKKRACILFTNREAPSRSLLDLMVESQSLIRHQHRWDISFTVRAWQPFGPERPFWMTFDKGSQEAIDATRIEKAIRIDLTNQLDRATGKFAEEARSGNWVLLGETLASLSGLKLGQKVQEAEEELKLAPLVDGPVGQSSLNLAALQAVENPGSSTDSPTSSKSAVKSERSESDTVIADQAAAASGISIAVKASLGVLVLIGLAIAAYFGIGMLRGINQIADNMGNEGIAIIGNKNSSQDVADVAPETDEDETQVDSEPPEQTSEKAPLAANKDLRLTRAELNTGLQAVAAETTFADLPSPESIGETTLFTIFVPPHQAGFRENMSALVKTVDGSYPFRWADENRLELSIDSKIIAEIVVTSQREFANTDAPEGGPTATVAETSELVKFLWRWTEAATAMQNQALRIAAGELQIGLIGDRSPLRLALAAPNESLRVRLLDASFKPVAFHPHLKDYFRIKQEFDRFRWSVTDARLMEASSSDAEPSDEKSDSPTLGFEVRFENGVTYLLISDDYIRAKVYSLLKIDLEDNSDLKTLADELLQYHGPFGLVLKPEIEFGPGNGNAIQFVSNTRLGFNAPGDDVGRIEFLDIPDLDKADNPQEVFRQLEEFVAIKLMQFTNTSGSASKRVIERFGKGCLKAPQDHQKVKLAICGSLFEVLQPMLQQEIAFDVSRSGGVARDHFSVPVLSKTGDKAAE